MVNKKIGLLQIATLAFFLTISSFILFFENIIKISRNDTFISIIIGSFISFILFSLILKLRKIIRFNNRIINIFISIFLLFIFIYILINSSNFIKSSFLSNGNFYSIFLLLLLVCLISSNKGYKELSSLSLILFFIFIPLFFINLIGSSFSLNITYLIPPFTSSFLDILKGSLLFVFYISTPLSFLLFIPYDEIDGKKRQDKYLYLAFIFAILIIIISYLLLYFSCNINVITNYNYPFMLVINTLSSTFILGRISYIISFYLLFSLIITLSLLICIIKQLCFDKYILKTQD